MGVVFRISYTHSPQVFKYLSEWISSINLVIDKIAVTSILVRGSIVILVATYNIVILGVQILGANTK